MVKRADENDAPLEVNRASTFLRSEKFALTHAFVIVTGNVQAQDLSVAVEALWLENEISCLVNEAYGLTPEEIALMWETAPPRMPIPRPG